MYVIPVRHSIVGPCFAEISRPTRRGYVAVDTVVPGRARRAFALRLKIGLWPIPKGNKPVRTDKTGAHIIPHAVRVIIKAEAAEEACSCRQGHGVQEKTHYIVCTRYALDDKRVSPANLLRKNLKVYHSY